MEKQHYGRYRESCSYHGHQAIQSISPHPQLRRKGIWEKMNRQERIHSLKGAGFFINGETIPKK